MKAPKFWQYQYAKPNNEDEEKSRLSFRSIINILLAILLAPLGEVYNFFTQKRINHKNPYRANIPVICMGNITAGGNGKTPTAIAIAQMLQKQKKQVCFVSKGYTGTINKKMPVIVDSNNHTADQVGDEPLLLSQVAMCIVCDSRERALIMAENLQVDVIIMDDGFQDGSIYKSHNIIVVDAMQEFGNGYCIPAGPCREKIEPALMRANACILIGDDKHHLQEFIEQFIPVIKASIKPKKFSCKKGIFAFAGIGNPSKFYKSLREIGFKDFATRDFKDHHKYSKKDLDKMPKDKQLVTTSKDFVKLPLDVQKKVKVLEIALKFEDLKLLKEVLK